MTKKVNRNKKNPMFKKNEMNFVIFLAVIALIFTGISIYIYNKNQYYNNLNHLDIVEDIIKNDFLTTNTSLNNVEKITDHELDSYYIALGENSFLREKELDDTSLSKYEELQNKYASEIEERYLNGTSYTVVEDENGNLLFSIKPWYLKTYFSDVLAISYKLLEQDGIDINLMYKNYDDYKVYIYKSKIKAMQILEDYLDYYENKDEICYFTFYFVGNKPAENQYLSLYFNLIGLTSDYMVDSDNISDQDKRVSEYLNKAIEKGIIDVNNPLKL